MYRVVLYVSMLRQIKWEARGDDFIIVSTLNYFQTENCIIYIQYVKASNT